MRDARKQLQYIDEARALLDDGERPPIGQPVDLTSAFARAQRGGVLTSESLCQIAALINNSADCAKFFKRCQDDYPELTDLGVGLTERRDLASDIQGCFDAEGGISDFASGDLRETRQRVRAMKGQLKERVEGLLKDESLSDMLQDDFYTLRDDRYVLPVKSGHKRHVDGIVHGWSSSGATVFIEPQVVIEANNRLRMAQAEEKQEVHRILTRLSRRVAKMVNDLRQSQEALISFDFLFACAQLSQDLDCTSPHLGTEPHLHLPTARHPLLALNKVKVVPNDIELGGDQGSVLVITGPNAGGKTVVMKTAGLLVMMAQSGLHIPADPGALVPWVPGLFSDMGDEQSLSEGQSTFSGHLANIQAILRLLKPNSLILLDELAIGTDPVQGAALAQAILEYLVSQGSLVLVTTHYEALKLLSTEDERFRNGAVEYDEAVGGPTYRLRYDMPGSSSALQIAAKLGLPEVLVERAQVLTGEQHQRLEGAITRLEREASEARAAKREAEAEARRLKDLTHKVEQRERKLREKTQKAIHGERSKAITEARALRDQVKELKTKLRQGMTESQLVEVERELTQSADSIAEAQVQDQIRDYPLDLDLKTLTVGQRVWVINLDMHAEVSKLPDNRGRCSVQAGMLQIEVDAESLRRPRSGESPATPQASNKRSKKQKRNAAKKRKQETEISTISSVPSWDRATPQTSDNTCDVRGQRSDEAVSSIVYFLDGIYRRGGTAAYIIHGHGTGALKRHLRGWLPSCDYVSEFRPGKSHEGGDGVTALLLTLSSI
jgi:DNA mismatch repair protein MutS2